jgi:hypothetical protein
MGRRSSSGRRAERDAYRDLGPCDPVDHHLPEARRDGSDTGYLKRPLQTFDERSRDDWLKLTIVRNNRDSEAYRACELIEAQDRW